MGREDDFFTYKEVNVEYLYIRNLLKPKVLGIGKFILKMTSEKRYILKKVLYTRLSISFR